MNNKIIFRTVDPWHLLYCVRCYQPTTLEAIFINETGCDVTIPCCDDDECKKYADDQASMFFMILLVEANILPC